MKCVRAWLRDFCEGTGVKKISFGKLTREIGEEITREEFDRYFGSKVHWIDEETIWVFGHIKEQQRVLSPRNAAHVNIAKLAIQTIEAHCPAEGQDLSPAAQSVFEELKRVVRASREDHSTSVLSSPDHHLTVVRGSDDSNSNIEGNIKNSSEEGGVGETKPPPDPRPTDRDLEAAYRAYPRKEGKDPGFRIARLEIKTFAELRRLEKAIFRYAALCAKDRKERQHILQFGTFMGRWRDFLDDDYGTLSLPSSSADRQAAPLKKTGDPWLDEAAFLRRAVAEHDAGRPHGLDDLSGDRLRLLQAIGGIPAISEYENTSSGYRKLAAALKAASRSTDGEGA